MKAKSVFILPHILPHLFPPIDKNIRLLQKLEKIKRQNCLHNNIHLLYPLQLLRKINSTLLFSLGERSQLTPSYFAPQDVIKHRSLHVEHSHASCARPQSASVHSGWKGGRRINFTAFWFVVFHCGICKRQIPWDFSQLGGIASLFAYDGIITEQKIKSIIPVSLLLGDGVVYG